MPATQTARTLPRALVPRGRGVAKKPLRKARPARPLTRAAAEEGSPGQGVASFRSYKGPSREPSAALFASIDASSPGRFRLRGGSVRAGAVTAAVGDVVLDAEQSWSLQPLRSTRLAKPVRSARAGARSPSTAAVLTSPRRASPSLASPLASPVANGGLAAFSKSPTLSPGLGGAAHGGGRRTPLGRGRGGGGGGGKESPPVHAIGGALLIGAAAAAACTTRRSGLKLGGPAAPLMAAEGEGSGWQRVGKGAAHRGAFPRLHAVSDGESLWSIATAAYGDGSCFADIIAANPGLREALADGGPGLAPGAHIRLPPP